MRIPKFWAKAEHRWPERGLLRVWRSSDRNEAEALAAAQARLAVMLEEIAAGRTPERPDYADRPVREEILGREGDAAIVTRNAQGAEVLNTARVMFLDLDFAHFKTGEEGGFLTSFFGKKTAATPESRARASLETWASGEPGIRLRIYQTRAGLRGLRLDRLYDPAGEEAQAALEAAGSDPLYSRLCRLQKSFRARLTPKYFRVGLKRIPGEWPCSDPEMAIAREAWLTDYEVRSRDVTICRLLGETGKGAVHPEAGLVLALHDRIALGPATLPLA